VTSPVPLADRVTAAGPRVLLPRRLTEESSAVPRAFELVEDYPLADPLRLLLLRAEGTLFVAPVVDVDGELRRADAGDGAAAALIGLLADPEAAAHGSMEWTRFDRAHTVVGERAMLVDQTHESVVVGERAVVKWMVRAEPTPAPTLVSHLTANGFTQLPQPWGFLSWTAGEVPIVVASIADFLPDARDGWDWCVADVGSFSRGESSIDAALEPVGRLGVLVAELHLALAQPSEVVQAPVQSATAGAVEAWHAGAVALAEQAMVAATGEGGGRLRARRDAIVESLAALAQVDETLMMPIHGDLHVGQVLRWRRGYALNDFDGNPVLAPVERLAPQPAARDVAGMLQSLDHVGRVVVRRVAGVDPDRTDSWIAAAQQLFLTTYCGALASGGRPDLLDERMLLPFRVEQELREFLYAELHLPRWRYVPDGAICSLFP
jgi:maltokinase